MTAVIIMGLITLCAIYLFVWAITTSLGKVNILWTKFALQGFVKIELKGDIVTNVLVSEKGKRYDRENDTIVEYETSLFWWIWQFITLQALWRWIGGLHYIGFRHSIAEFKFDRHVFGMTDTSEGESDIVMREIDITTTEMSLAIDLAFEAHQVETKGALFGFFKPSVRLEVVHPLFYYGMLKAMNSGNKKAIVILLSVLKVYAKGREIHTINEEDTTLETGPFQTIMRSANDKLLLLTGLKIVSIELPDWGVEQDEHNMNVLKTTQLKELNKLQGEANLVQADFEKQAAAIQLQTRKLQNDGEKDYLEKTVVYAAKNNANENFKYEKIANSNINVLAEGGGGRTTIAIPPSGSPEKPGQPKNFLNRKRKPQGAPIPQPADSSAVPAPDSTKTDSKDDTQHH